MRRGKGKRMVASDYQMKIRILIQIQKQIHNFRQTKTDEEGEGKRMVTSDTKIRILTQIHNSDILRQTAGG